MKKVKKVLKIVAIVFIVLFLLAFIANRIFFKAKPVEVEKVVTSVEVINPSIKEIINYASQIGTISPSESFTLIAKSSGEIKEINREVGDFVNEGDILASLDKSNLDTLKIQMDSAKIALDDANLALARSNELFAAGAISGQNLEQASSGQKAADLAYKAAKSNYELQSKNINISSPIAGVVEAKYINLHDTIQMGSPAFVVSSKEEMIVKFGITDSAKDFISVGDTAEVEYNNSTYKATIVEIEDVVSAMSGLYNVKANIENASHLTNGTKVKISFIKAKVSDKLSIPVSAVYYTNGNPFVYVYQDGKAIKRDVEIGIYDDENIVILSGLNKEDQLIYTYSSELYDGADVAVKE